MSEENVEIVLNQFEAVNTRDFAAAMDGYAEDVTLVLHGLELTVTGKAAVGGWFGDWFGQFGPDYRFDVTEARASRDLVFVVATHYGQGKASRVPVEQRTAYVYTVRAGKVSRVEVWSDRDEALEAAGLSE